MTLSTFSLFFQQKAREFHDCNSNNNKNLKKTELLSEAKQRVSLFCSPSPTSRPRSKRFYGSDATSGLSAADCAVSVTSTTREKDGGGGGGVIEATFKRSAILTVGT